jgi:hypothetical protein
MPETGKLRLILLRERGKGKFKETENTGMFALIRDVKKEIKMKRLLRKKLNIGVWLLFLSTGLIVNSCIVDPDHDHDNVDNNSFVASQEFLYRINTDNRSEFILHNINGSVEIIGVANITQVEIQGEKRVESDSQSDADTHLELLRVVVDSSDAWITVNTMQPSRSEGRNYIVHYHVRIPLDWRVITDQVNGNIRLVSLTGASNHTASLKQGLADSLQTEIAASLVNGSLLLYDLRCSVNGQVVNGDITGNIAIPLDGECILQVTNGVINLTIPRSTSALFSAVTVNGAVAINGLTLNNAQTSQKSVSGSLGDGRGRINLSGVNTNIVVWGTD